ncbi:Smr/MutS family protein [Candidatus Deferrimicrobium sp.]|uniref:Smr/MutS family protein n=1 Tax=Candidatus Deferrimicrobium sp. TaxID=3060586 RepID=UPI002ED2FC01
MAGGEIDLHGLTVADALSRFAAHYNTRLRAGDTGPIRVIHGYGSSGRGGDLRTALRELLARHAGRLEFVPGETYFNNPGVTIVYPKHPLPAPSPNLRTGRR